MSDCEVLAGDTQSFSQYMKWLGENVQKDVTLVTKLVTREGLEKFEIAESKAEAGSPSRNRTSDPMINSPYPTYYTE